MSRPMRAAAMALLAGVAAAWAVGACAALAGCSRPGPAPVAPGTAPWLALVEAGCVVDDPSGPGAVADELDAGIAPPWLSCLADGGTVAACGVPCGPDVDALTP